MKEQKHLFYLSNELQVDFHLFSRKKMIRQQIFHFWMQLETFFGLLE